MKFFGQGQPKAQYSFLQKALIEELLRQTRLTFNLALVVSAIASVITLSGVGLLYFNKITAASLTTGVGTLATISSIQFAKQTKADLKEITSLTKHKD
ncbi:MAG: hypothetical protein WA865_23115 [Spirulinaceae cyanobacterium]